MVDVISAKGLPRVDTLGTADPFVELFTFPGVVSCVCFWALMVVSAPVWVPGVPGRGERGVAPIHPPPPPPHTHTHPPTPSHTLAGGEDQADQEQPKPGVE